MPDPRLQEELRERVLGDGTPTGDVAEALVLADAAQQAGDLELTAAALDRAYGLAPGDPRIAAQRAHVLDQLAVTEHGLVFRYVPAGTFLMGSMDGDADERPVHPKRLGGFWLTNTPVTWADFARLMGWSEPPNAEPPEVETPGEDFDQARFNLGEENKLRTEYCGVHGSKTRWWERPNESHWNVMPMVAVSWQSAEQLAAKLSNDLVRYRLPTEAAWERAARGGLIGKRYSWGDEAPTPARCDFGHFGDFNLKPPLSLPPNGYGLHGMCGGVSEWTRDLYDALAYSPQAPGAPTEAVRERVIRGGSFVDSPSAVTVSFRAHLGSSDWASAEGFGGHMTPTVGFRLARYRAR